MLDSTVESVTSALKRARASLQHQRSPTDARDPAPAPDSPSERALVAEFVRAYESADLDAAVALLTDDVFVSIPPMRLEYEGRDVVARFCAGILQPGPDLTSSRRERTVNRRSAPTSALPTASATAPACSCSLSPATASAP